MLDNFALGCPNLLCQTLKTKVYDGLHEESKLIELALHWLWKANHLEPTYLGIFKSIKSFLKLALLKNLLGNLRFHLANVKMKFKKDIVISCKLGYTN